MEAWLPLYDAIRADQVGEDYLQRLAHCMEKT